MKSKSYIDQLRPTDSLAIEPAIVALPKADIHVHAEAAARLDRVIRPDHSKDWRAWIESTMSNVEPGTKRLEAMASVPLDTSRDTEPEILEARLFDLLQESAKAGSVLIEVRTGSGSLDNPNFEHAFRNAESLVALNYPGFTAELVITHVVDPDTTISERVFQMIVESTESTMVGVDIIPTPYAEEADWQYLNGWCERIAAKGLGITVHAGEFSGANIRSAINAPGVTRIGHGVHAGYDDRLLSEVVERNITVEVCISSNLVFGAIGSYTAHPLQKFVAAGAKLVLGSDDPVRVGTNIAREYQIARYLGLDSSQLRALTRQAILSSFAPAERKRSLLASIDESG